MPSTFEINVTIGGHFAATTRTLFKTDNRTHANKVIRAVEKVVGCTPPERKAREVVVVYVDRERLLRFTKSTKLVTEGSRFRSVKHLAFAMNANPATLRVALSKCYKNEDRYATTRGVGFRYV